MSLVKGKRLNVWLQDGYDDKIQELLKLLDEQGVDLRDPKKPENLSQSALLRHLIDEALKKAGRKK